VDEYRLSQQILARIVESGYSIDSEPFRICQRAIRFLSFSYNRSEELEAARRIDCSTLVSQAHWEGAAIGIPFVAESQRKAVSAVSVASISDIRPADVMIRYESLTASPDREFNHVGLYLGSDDTGEGWLIEARGGVGVCLSRVADFEARGGIRRFTLSAKPFDAATSKSALNLAPLVPKLGRLGARQYTSSPRVRTPHRGLDYYVPTGTPVYAPNTGLVASAYDTTEDSRGIVIQDDDITVRLLQLEQLAVLNGEHVERGDLVGVVGSVSQRSSVRYSSSASDPSHLHLEVEFRRQPYPACGPVASIDDRTFGNHLYIAKSGRLALPFAESTMAAMRT
jgi:hypothetical protein